MYRTILFILFHMYCYYYYCYCFVVIMNMHITIMIDTNHLLVLFVISFINRGAWGRPRRGLAREARRGPPALPWATAAVAAVGPWPVRHGARGWRKCYPRGTPRTSWKNENERKINKPRFDFCFTMVVASYQQAQNSPRAIHTFG